MTHKCAHLVLEHSDDHHHADTHEHGGDLLHGLPYVSGVLQQLRYHRDGGDVDEAAGSERKDPRSAAGTLSQQADDATGHGACVCAYATLNWPLEGALSQSDFLLKADLNIFC